MGTVSAIDVSSTYFRVTYELHPSKCKESIVDFSKNKQVFDPITVDGVHIPVVSKANVLGLTISNNLLWFTSYLNARRQTVTINNIISSEKNTGCPKKSGTIKK